MNLRTLTNANHPIGAPGAPGPGSRLEFLAVAADGKTVLPILIEGATAHGGVRVDVDESGIFAKPLPVTDGSSPEAYYLVRVTSPGMDAGTEYQTAFVAPLPAGEGDLQWEDFYLPGTPLEPGEWSAFMAHLRDDVRHLTDPQIAAIANIDTFVVPAGEILGGDKVIYLDGGAAYLASAASVPYGSTVGFTVHAAEEGNSVSVRTTGQITRYGLVPDSPYYLGEAGDITNVPPIVGIIIPVGWARTTDQFIVRFGAAIARAA